MAKTSTEYLKESRLCCGRFLCVSVSGKIERAIFMSPSSQQIYL